MRSSLWLCGLLCATACGQTDTHGAADADATTHTPSGAHDAAVPQKDAGNAGKPDAGHDAGTAHDAGMPKDSGTPVDANMKPKDAAASGADAAHADAGAADAATPKCSAAFCEDFESGSLNTTTWTRKETSNGNSVQIQSTKKAHGQYAAQFHAKGGTSLSMILLENLPDALQKHYFGRLYYYASDFPTESGGHTAYITSSNTLKNFPDSDHHLEVSSYSSDSGPIWQMTYWTGDGPEYIGSGGQIPKASWFCLEWEFNDAPDEIGVWVDGDATKKGASFRNINNHASNLLGKMTTLGVGFRTWHPMGAPDIDVYIDDIALDSKRVGCIP
jgi:hypothetical protein